MIRLGLFACSFLLAMTLVGCGNGSLSAETPRGDGNYSYNEYSSDRSALSQKESDLNRQGCWFRNTYTKIELDCGDLATEAKIVAIENYNIEAGKFLDKYSNATVVDGNDNKVLTQEFKDQIQKKRSLCVVVKAKVETRKAELERIAAANAADQTARAARTAAAEEADRQASPLTYEIKSVGKALSITLISAEFFRTSNTDFMTYFRSGKVIAQSETRNASYCYALDTTSTAAQTAPTVVRRMDLISEKNTGATHEVTFLVSELGMMVTCKKTGATAYAIQEIKEAFGNLATIGVLPNN